MSQICEACELTSAQVVESCDDPIEPYHVCFGCRDRLQSRSLRPLEWYNLAKRHGWGGHLLHDDFYDEDGTATQPEQQVDDPAMFPAPTLISVAPFPEQLLDYSITRWRFGPELVEAWSQLPQSEVLETLSQRFAASRNCDVRSTLLSVCTSALRELGADLVRYAWGEVFATIPFSSLAKASAACLPFREGFDRVRTAIDQSDFEKRDLIYALSYFHSPERWTGSNSKRSSRWPILGAI